MGKQKYSGFWGRIPSSDELVWLKGAFFTVRRMTHTASWKNTYSEAKIAIRQPARTAELFGRVAGEVRYA